MLVNNVGVQFDNGKPAHLLDEEIWDTVLNVNVKSHFLMAKYCLPGMLKHRAGCIVNIGSVQGRQSQVRHELVFSASIILPAAALGLLVGVCMYVWVVGCTHARAHGNAVLHSYAHGGTRTHARRHARARKRRWAFRRTRRPRARWRR